MSLKKLPSEYSGRHVSRFKGCFGNLDTEQQEELLDFILAVNKITGVNSQK